MMGKAKVEAETKDSLNLNISLNLLKYGAT